MPILESPEIEDLCKSYLDLISALYKLFNDYSDRLLEEFKQNLECDKNHPGAKKFIRDFVLKTPKFKNISPRDLEETEKIIFTGTFMANPEQKRPVDDILSGNIKLRNIHGQTTLSLCSFEELKKWAQEAPFWKWLGWSIVVISVVLSIFLLIIEEIIKKHSV